LDVLMDDKVKDNQVISLNVNPIQSYAKTVYMECFKGAGTPYFQSVQTNQFTISVGCDPSTPNFVDSGGYDTAQYKPNDTTCFWSAPSAAIQSSS
jgi:hypothetical protein